MDYLVALIAALPKERASFLKPYVQGVIATPLEGDIYGIFDLPNISLAEY
jgi:hypothetical protein